MLSCERSQEKIVQSKKLKNDKIARKATFKR
jgi:hypothetical protein